MAEISEPSETPPSMTETDNQKPVRKTKPGLKRLALTLIVLFSFLLGFPFLLKSTEIYRSPLPFQSIDSLSNRLESNPLSIPCRFQAVFIGFDGERSKETYAEKLGVLISEDLRKRRGSDATCGGCGTDFTVSVTIDSGKECARSKNAWNSCSWQCGAVDLDESLNDAETVDEILELGLQENVGKCSEFGGKLYSVVVVNREEATTIVVGKHRHSWIIGRFSEDATISSIGKLFVEVFMNGGKGKGLLGKGGEFMPVGADGSVVLSFSLLNSDPNDWVYDWDFQKIDEILLAPVVEALAPIANISVESQVLYHTPKSSFSYWDEKLGSHIFSTGDLPFFVNSNEWHLDTSIAAAGRSKVLQFVVYIPSAKECPLLLRQSDGEISATNGFISPMWGGVIVWNPPRCSREYHDTHLLRHTFSTQELQKVFQVFMGQLRLLLGLESDNVSADEAGLHFLASGSGFAEWELDALFRHHTCFNLLSCATTLGSLSRLFFLVTEPTVQVQSLPRMIVMDEIGKQVKFSLEAATLSQNNASDGIYDASAVSSRQARALAEDAFFHPSIMSVSYSSIEHYFAIYMPFFAPVTLHVLLAAIKELKRYKKERAKYMAWNAQAEAS